MGTRELDNQKIPRELDFQFTTLPKNTDPLWTVNEVAKYLRVKPETVRAFARNGKISGIKMGRIWRFKKSMVDDFIVSQIQK